MSTYDNRNTGAIFTNEKKNENQPDFKGTINVEGKDYEIAIWNKTSKKGTPFMSAKIQEPRKQEPTNEQAKVESDLPF